MQRILRDTERTLPPLNAPLYVGHVLTHLKLPCAPSPALAAMTSVAAVYRDVMFLRHRHAQAQRKPSEEENEDLLAACVIAGAYVQLTKLPISANAGRRKRIRPPTQPGNAMDIDETTAPLASQGDEGAPRPQWNPHHALEWALERIRELRSSLVGAYWDVLCAFCLGAASLTAQERCTVGRLP